MDKDIGFINTQKGISDFVDWVALRETSNADMQPPLYIDAEGEKLSRYGKISLLTVLAYSGKDSDLERTHIIDIHTLGAGAFSTVGGHGKSFKDILESPQILKVFFDVRNDSDALYAHYGIKLQGIRDVQLMENARRPSTARRRHVSGLSRCIEELLSKQERDQWRLGKQKGEALWNPDKGGSYNVFNTRPLANEVMSYCVGDVQYLPALYRKYRCDTVRWRNLIAEESQKRVSASQAAEYQPYSREKARSPWSPEQNRMLDSLSTIS
ncbi:ribonuclease H-like domain-containing protein [Aspergillus coremiiformis]|uniref:Ribonuclease H-like domain-containing protein n=1 Tax=Aspergillus coremiiformis TaxID=138285 RepID=A0A5N6Z1P3_9EURO|nr:ribonuclease H-like domain-containing protein [Aspergillus coremiiformis]